MRTLIFLICIIFTMPTAALGASDIIATYLFSDGSRVTICTRDKQHVRMNTSPDSYLLLSGDNVYSVTRMDNGDWSTMDMNQMAAIANGMGSMLGSSMPEYNVRLEKTNKTEKVAGYSGLIYTAVVFEDGKLASKEEVVLGNHANLKKLTHAWVAVAETMSSLSATFGDSIEEAKKLGYGGILRYGDELKLENITTKDLGESYYQLPKKVQQVQAPSEAKKGNETAEGQLEDKVQSLIKDLF